MANSTLFVSEISSNHSSDLERCKNLIAASHDVGCNAVKFQLFKVNELFAPEILSQSKRHRDRAAWELPVSFLPHLMQFCHDLELQFACTPFYMKAVEELEPFVDFFKVSSYEMIWDDLIIECARTGKDIVISTGMATMDEIKNAVEKFRSNSDAELTLLHTISGYPTPAHEANLMAIDTLRKAFECNVGLSDHSVSPGVIYRAIHRWGASMVEFHLDLDASGAEYENGHCWLPYEIKPIIQNINSGNRADGNGKKMPMPIEKEERLWRADPSDGLRPLKRLRASFDG